MTDPQTKRFFIRFSSAGDHDRIVDFHQKHPHPNVFGREPGLFARMISGGSTILVEAEDGRIIAASTAYPMTAPGSDAARWVEVGTTRIAEHLAPKLFDAFIAMQVLRTFAVEPPEDRMVAQMLDDSKPVQKLAQRVGWRPYPGVPDEIIAAKQAMHTDHTIERKPTEWFQFSVEALPLAASFLIRVIDDPVLKTDPSGETSVLDFSRSGFIRLFEPEIRVLAGQDLGDIENPDYSRGLHAERDGWMRNVFR